jgi:hypothetical protein
MIGWERPAESSCTKMKNCRGNAAKICAGAEMFLLAEGP